jgi:hypothetical protein
MDCAYRFYVTPLTAHEALCHAGNMTSVHRPRSWLYAYMFYMSPLMAHEVLYYTRCMTDPHSSWITTIRLPVLSKFVINIRVNNGKVSYAAESMDTSVETRKKSYVAN